MEPESPEPTWEALSAEILSGLREWRLQHPKATLTEIEAALDERWYRLRVRMLRDVALQSSTANWQESSAAERPTCPGCGTPLLLRGKRAPAQDLWWAGSHPPSQLWPLPNL